MTGPVRGSRHVWVDASGGPPVPGLLIGWRRETGGDWEAQVAAVRGGSVLLDWVPVTRIRPVTDDGWRP